MRRCCCCYARLRTCCCCVLSRTIRSPLVWFYCIIQTLLYQDCSNMSIPDNLNLEPQPPNPEHCRLLHHEPSRYTINTSNRHFCIPTLQYTAQYLYFTSQHSNYRVLGPYTLQCGYICICNSYGTQDTYAFAIHTSLFNGNFIKVENTALTMPRLGTDSRAALAKRLQENTLSAAALLLDLSNTNYFTHKAQARLIELNLNQNLKP